jgi:hypothetical protein
MVIQQTVFESPYVYSEDAICERRWPQAGVLRPGAALRARGPDTRKRARARHAVVLERRRAYWRADDEVATAVGALLALRLTRPSAR